MFENLINLVRQNAGDAVINNPAIPNEKNEEAVETASGSIVSTLKNALAVVSSMWHRRTNG
jgi:F0F1-type ATP synthase delta subunit